MADDNRTPTLSFERSITGRPHGGQGPSGGDPLAELARLIGSRTMRDAGHGQDARRYGRDQHPAGGECERRSVPRTGSVLRTASGRHIATHRSHHGARTRQSYDDPRYADAQYADPRYADPRVAGSYPEQQRYTPT